MARTGWIQACPHQGVLLTSHYLEQVVREKGLKPHIRPSSYRPVSPFGVKGPGQGSGRLGAKSITGIITQGWVYVTGPTRESRELTPMVFSVQSAGAPRLSPKAEPWPGLSLRDTTRNPSPLLGLEEPTVTITGEKARRGGSHTSPQWRPLCLRLPRLLPQGHGMGAYWARDADFSPFWGLEVLGGGASAAESWGDPSSRALCGGRAAGARASLL